MEKFDIVALPYKGQEKIWDNDLATLIEAVRVSDNIIRVIINTRPRYCDEVFYSTGDSLALTFMEFDEDENGEIVGSTLKIKTFTLAGVQADTVHISPCKHQYMFYILQGVHKSSKEYQHIDWTLIEEGL